MSSKVLNVLGEKSTVTTDKGLQRAEEILLAARDLLIQEGYAGLSMRGIAARINISLSTVQHYYKSQEVLIESLLSYLINNLQHKIGTLISSMSNKGQLERLEVVLDFLLIECRNPDVVGVYTEAWALAQRLPFATRLMEQVEERERKQFYKLIYGLNPTIDREEYLRRASLIPMLLHGLMLQFPPNGTSVLSREQLESATRAQVLQLAIRP